MQFQFLGTGDAAGVPVHGCDCHACATARHDPSRIRRPCSAELSSGGQRWLIDAGLMDLVERYPEGSPDGNLDGIFLTHFHVDHVQGLFRLRWSEGQPLPVRCPPDREGCADLFKHPGVLLFSAMRKYEPVDLGGLRVTPVPLIHSKPTLGYCFDDGELRLAYLTDTAGLPPKVIEFLQQWRPDHMVIDTRNPPTAEPSGGHNDLNQTLALHAEIGPGRTWLTHLSHDMDRWLLRPGNTLPNGVTAARDGLVLGG